MLHDLVICVSDLHAPFHHPDAIKFLRAIKKKYWAKAKRPMCVILGDELTWHSISYHEKDPSMPNPSLELDMALGPIRALYELFPKAKVLDSNHGSLLARKMKTAGLPANALRSPNDILEIPRSDWQWVGDLTIKVTGSKQVYFCHGRSSDVTKLGQMMGMCAVQGHYHERFKTEHWSTTNGNFWSMQCGCLIDNTSKDFDYNKLNLKSPVIGTGIILNGDPMLIRMKLDANNRWTGEL